MEPLLAALNPEQRRAVSCTGRPLLVLAGAGTGKTRVITHRIAWLIEQGVKPREVLAVTFTNKAAGEMRARVAALVGAKQAADLTLGTFHSFCARLLREHGEAIGLPARFAICDASDQLGAAKQVLRELRVPEARLHPRLLQARVSLLKNRMVSRESLAAGSGGDEDELLALAWERYDAHLRRSRLLDFDDLLLETLRLLDEAPRVRGALRRRYRHLMVDEFQDTNAPQFEIVRRLAGKKGCLCVVGDDDQSIYGWRGADPRGILDFEKHFPGAEVVRLETNYRSTTDILEAANTLITQNSGRHDKCLRSHTGGGAPPEFLDARDEEDEADFIVGEIEWLRKQNRARAGDFAILFRAAVQARVFETALRARGLPYRLVGGPSFFDRKEVRDLLAFLRLLANPDDEISLLRVLNTPPRGVGKTSVDRVLAFATEHGISAAAAFDRAGEIPKLSDTAREAVTELREGLADLARRERGRNLVEIVRTLVEQVSYRTEVERCYDDPLTREARWAAVGELLNLAENHVRHSSSPGLEAFLEELTLDATEDDADSDAESGDAVSLMTLHAAKGLEFPRVYLVGLEEGLLPHARAVADGGIEEERRLAYVGVTRARQHLSVSWAAERARQGRRELRMASRFLFELRGETPPETWRSCEAAAAEPRADSAQGAGGKGRGKAGRKKSGRGKSAGGKRYARGR